METAEKSFLKMNTIVAFGNPLLDISVVITNNDILQKYNLNANDQKEVSKTEIENILTDIKSLHQNISPGGLAQNTLRVMQWLIRKKFSTTIFGGVGNDERGKNLKILLEKDGVETSYIIKGNSPTGLSIALIQGTNRSLVAHLGAAEILSTADLKEHPNIIHCLEKADLVYIEGFFLTKRIQTAQYILDYCLKHQQHLVFNLSGKYLCENETKHVENFALKSNIVFGNRDEYEILAKSLNISFLDLIRKLGHSCSNKIVVITNEAQPVILYYLGEVQEFSVPEFDVAEILDTTGAGDAFVAGFLTGYLLKRAPINCVELGCYAAQEILKRIGCTLPRHLPNVQL